MLAGEKLRMKSTDVAEPVTVESEEWSVDSDQVSTANNRSYLVADDERSVYSGCKGRFDTARG